MLFFKEDGSTKWFAFMDNVRIVCEKCGELISQITYSSDARGSEFSDLYVYCPECKEYYTWEWKTIKFRGYEEAVALARDEAYINDKYQVVYKEE
jgi:uncharacterized protein with PIN domain